MLCVEAMIEMMFPVNSERVKWNSACKESVLQTLSQKPEKTLLSLVLSSSSEQVFYVLCRDYKFVAQILETFTEQHLLEKQLI